MSKFGPLAYLVSTAGSLAAAASAIGLAFTERAKWQPPEEAVPAGTSRVSALVAMVFVAIIYVLGNTVGLISLAAITILFLLLAIICLVTSISTNIRYSFFYPTRDEKGTLSGAALAGC
jgi:protein-S-isoprenylcysteine O-methyltransferase Ste14